jgi:hypothetical protein
MLLFALFLVVAALTYLHLIGLPDFVKQPLLRHLREKGFEVRFTRMHLGFGPAVIIENVAFSRTDQAFGPRLSAGKARLALDFDALRHSRLEVDSLEVLDGRLQLPLSATNDEALSLDKVRLEVALQSNNAAQFQDVTASFRGIQIRLNGEISDFQLLRSWRFPFRLGKTAALAPRTGTTNAPPQEYEPKLRQVADIIRQIRFSGTPLLELTVNADGADMDSLRADLTFTAPEASTPWGDAKKVRLQAYCAHPINSGDEPIAQVRMAAERVTTRWGVGDHVSIEATVAKNAATNFDASVIVAGSGLETAWKTSSGSNYWVRAVNARWDGEATAPSTSLSSATVKGVLRVIQGSSSRGSASSLILSFQAQRATDPVPANAAWGEWNRIAPYSMDWQVDAIDVSAPRLRIQEAALRGRWSAPDVEVQMFHAGLYGGHVDGQADLDVASREVRVRAAADFDPHNDLPLLTPSAQRWLSQFTWTNPPKVQGALRLVLPPWTNRPDDWKEAFRSNVAVTGDFTVGPAAFRGVTISAASSHFTYTNRAWNIPRLHATRPEGALDLDYTWNDSTHDFHFTFDSTLAPGDVLGLLQPAQQRLAREVAFSLPPEIHGQAWGRWRSPEKLAISATMAATNFTARGERIATLVGRVDYTNSILRVSDARLAKAGGALIAPLVTADIPSKTIVLTNIQCTLDPALLPRVLGSNTPSFFKEIHFGSPPDIRASGSFVWTNPLATDLHFQIEGEHFAWNKVAADNISGKVNWLARHVEVTNVQARAYKTGTLAGWVTFDYAPKRDSSFRTDFSVHDIDLSQLARGLSGRSNRLEGLLDAHLRLQSARSSNKNALMGHGDIFVHDALLWDIKLFGILTPVLNAISPGAGESRASEASAGIGVENGVIWTDNLEVSANGYRLRYSGNVTMDEKITGRVEANLLRDTPLLGPVLSLLLTPLSKLFEYHISGTMRNPTIEPIFIPKALMMLIRPFHTLKSILPENTTPAPAPPPATTPK